LPSNLYQNRPSPEDTGPTPTDICFSGCAIMRGPWSGSLPSIRIIRTAREFEAAIADLNRAAELLMRKPLGAPIASGDIP
jgi:hypothetical protein